MIIYINKHNIKSNVLKIYISIIIRHVLNMVYVNLTQFKICNDDFLEIQ